MVDVHLAPGAQEELPVSDSRNS